MRYGIRFVVALSLLHFLAGTSAAVTRDEIESAVTARYKVTKTGFFGNFKEIGSVLVVRKGGLRANRPTNAFKPNVIGNGEVAQAGGGDLPLGGSLDGNLKIGDRLHLYGIHAGDDYVELSLFTVDTFVVVGSGTRGPTPLQASTRFRYDRGLAAVGGEQVMGDIDAWFGTEGMPVATGAAHPGPAVEPSQGETRTIRLGQTTDEVVAILGEPVKKVLLGAKAVYVYDDLKVVFVDGKVADAE